MIRILHYIPGFLYGGIESMFLEWYRHIDHKNIEFELLLRTQDDNAIALKQYREMHGKYYRLPKKSEIGKYIKKVNLFFKKHHDYDIIHAHSADLIVLAAAKKYKIPVIIHSHTTQLQKTDGLIKNSISYIESYVSKKIFADYAFACSKEAAKWKYGGLTFKGRKVTIIHNAIDANKYKFNSVIRNEIRSKLEVENKFVIGDVGRLTYPKNQFYLLDIFKSVTDIIEESILLVIGDGPDEEPLKKYAQDLGIFDKVKFLGNRNDVNYLMQAMDVFLFPSRYEGLGIVAIEAQAAGLQTICSTEVPRIAKLTNLIQFVPLSFSPEEWAKIICDKKSNQRMDTSLLIAKKGYDIETEITKLIDKYMEIIVEC